MKAAQAVVKPMPVLIEAVGTVEAEHSVQVRAQVSGVLQSVQFKEGDKVKAGQVLFQIDPRTFQAQYNQALAQLARDKAQLENARAQQERLQPLLKREYITRQEYDVAVTSTKSLEATVAADQAAAEQARIQLEFARITAPISGRTGTLAVKPGNLVPAAGSGTPLVTINTMDPILVGFSVPERQLDDIRRYQNSKEFARITRADLRAHGHARGQAGQPRAGRGHRHAARHDQHDGSDPRRRSASRSASSKRSGASRTTSYMRIEILADRNAPPVAEGKLVFIDNTVTPQTGTVLLKTRVPNANEVIWPGQFVNVRIVLTIEPEAVVVPEAAVQPGQDGSFVYLIDENSKVKVQPVKIARQIGGEVVIAEGVKGGDRVITEIPQALDAGRDRAARGRRRRRERRQGQGQRRQEGRRQGRRRQAEAAEGQPKRSRNRRRMRSRRRSKERA